MSQICGPSFEFLSSLTKGTKIKVKIYDENPRIIPAFRGSTVECELRSFSPSSIESSLNVDEYIVCGIVIEDGNEVLYGVHCWMIESVVVFPDES